MTKAPYLLMEYVEGVPVTEIIRRAHQLGELIPIQVCCAILKQIADGLHAAHELLGIDGKPLNLVHRDVSPSNVMVELNGHVRVTDFGIAKAAGGRTRTATGMLKGKLGYMAPEMLRFEKPDRRADIFSLGVVLYEMVTSERLYRGKEFENVAKRIMHEAPPDLQESRRGVPDALVELCFQMLGKDPSPSDSAEVSRRLGEILLECVEREGPVDVAEWIADHIDESVLEERREKGAKATRLRQADAPTAETPPRPRESQGYVRRTWRAVALAGLVLALGTVVGWKVHGSSSASVENELRATRSLAGAGSVSRRARR